MLNELHVVGIIIILTTHPYRNHQMSNEIQARMLELCEPIERQIMMCDNREDILMMACVMLDKVKVMLDSQIGVKGRREIIDGANK